MNSRSGEVPIALWQKSSFSSDVEGGSCIELTRPVRRRKSSHSTDAEGSASVELAHSPHAILLRESDAPNTVLAITPTALGALLHTAKTGRIPAR
ncbi:DUF397 domain-containing protein [Streptomyces boncukensis]|uniref:DUF397 domain-containing protein n=1 Tax=Streptomyces boncukensis TaxID=2711219 RepID=A0A6G4WVA8_9ACTN|nr:DUF397 domain-containing protein [Streptomyces boncukensis]NGO69048.1 DUF397 domain-containing protein [Streptomyces boncukensis]